MPNVLTEKLGPLPLWGWLGIATAGVLLVASKGKSSNTSAQQSAAAQQQLAAEEAALANSAQTATSSNSGSTYGSGGSAYSGNGWTGYTAPSYSTTPAASTTAPAATTTTPTSGSGSSTAMTTAPSSTVTSPGVGGFPANFLDPVTAGGQTYYIPPVAASDAAPAAGLENATQAYTASGQSVELYQPAGSTTWQTSVPQPT